MSKKSRNFAADLVIPKAYSMNRTIFVIMVLVLSSAFSPALAAVITHNFDDKFKARPMELSFYAENTKATTNDGYTYTCSGNAEFGIDGGYLYLLMPKSGDDFILSPAITDLAEILLYYSPFTSPPYPNYHIQVYISSDGSSWGDPLPAARLTKADIKSVKVLIPKGTHYVRIRHTDNTAIKIQQITYTTSDCNCFQYIPE